MTKFEEFRTALIEAGFEDTDNTTYCIFDGDEVPEYEGGWREAGDKFNEIANKYNFRHVEAEGGHEGGGEYCYGVIEVDGTFFKAEWSYYSYNGCEYDYINDTIKEVTPVTKTITVYE